MSESSDLSEAPSDAVDIPTDQSKVKQKKTLKLKQGKLNFSSTQHDVPRQITPESPPPPPRDPSPEHEYVLADNPDIAFLTMFRHRFADAFPKHMANLGPQDIERGVVESPANELIEHLLCSLLGLTLNRKKDVERGHFNRALEEAISANKHQWPIQWNYTNPLPGQRTFADMSPEEKLTLLRALTLWSLNSSDIIKDTIAAAYKQTRKEDDLNQPLSIQSWGLDGKKRKYWLIEGQNDTSFRIYKQSDPKLGKESWWSVAGSLDELRALADDLRINDGSQAARRLADRMELAIPRLEVSEEKRRRKEYRLNRKAAFVRPEPGFSLYEGRTRGKRMKYTFSDEEDEASDTTGTRQSNRQSDRSTPADTGPTMTSSGRQVRSRYGRSYGDPIAGDGQASRAGSMDPLQADLDGTGRARRGQRSLLRNRQDAGNDTSEEEDGEPSGDDWQGDDADFEGKHEEDEEDEMTDGESDDSMVKKPKSLIVKLRYRRGPPHPGQANGTAMHNLPQQAKVPPARSPAPPNSANGLKHQPSANTNGLTRPPSSARQDAQFKPDPYGPYHPHMQQPLYLGNPYMQHQAPHQHQHPPQPSFAQYQYQPSNPPPQQHPYRRSPHQQQQAYGSPPHQAHAYPHHQAPPPQYQPGWQQQHPPHHQSPPSWHQQPSKPSPQQYQQPPPPPMYQHGQAPFSPPRAPASAGAPAYNAAS